jgi:hypothetical protein
MDDLDRGCSARGTAAWTHSLECPTFVLDKATRNNPAKCRTRFRGAGDPIPIVGVDPPVTFGAIDYDDDDGDDGHNTHNTEERESCPSRKTTRTKSSDGIPKRTADARAPSIVILAVDALVPFAAMRRGVHSLDGRS